MKDGPSEPLVTVAVSTYKRRALLERAVESVLDQTYENWELVISDNEAGKGPTWRYIRGLAAREGRIRAVKNKNGQGPAANMNNALKEAQGAWIKLLHDDDVLKPGCLSELVELIQIAPSAVCITCGIERHVNGEVRAQRSSFFRWPLVEIIPSDQVHLGMYLLEDVGGPVPSQQMISREVVDRGIWMEENNGLCWMVDCWFNARVAQLGDVVVYRKPLVEWHQGGHSTVTGMLSDERKDKEALLLREMLWKLIPDKTNAPPPHLMRQTVLVVRAAWRIKKRRFREGVQLLRKVKSPGAYWQFFLWVMHTVSKGHYTRIQRETVSPLHDET